MAERVFLHIGTPKSGTTYLQTILWRNVARLKADGLLVPGRFETHYAAAKAVTGRTGLRRETRIDIARAWPRLVNQANRFPRRALVSHELFAPASREQAQAAKEALQASELHLIVTARALHHQLPASWQEQVKSGLPTPYEVFLARVREEQAKGAWFWEVQDLASIAQRWGDDIPPERIHIVTVPPDRSDPTLLWRRYASVLGLDPLAYDTDTPIRNASLGLVESELLRRLHAVRDERFTDGGRHPWTRKLLATKTLTLRGGDRLGLPDETRGWLSDRAAAMRQAVEAARYHVVGDLDDLDPRLAPGTRTRSVDSVTAAELAEASAWTIARLRAVLQDKHPTVPLPAVSDRDGVEGILELLEHIRGADSGTEPRPRRRNPETESGASWRTSVAARVR
jgi:hypothetical protein